MNIREARAYFYYLYDVSNEIDLKEVESLLKEKTTEAELPVYRRLTPEYIRYAVPPLLLKLVTKKFQFGKRMARVSVYAKIFDVGVIVFIAHTDFKGSSTELIKYSSETLRPELEKIVIGYRDALLKKISPALVKPSPSPFYSEDYVVYHVKRLDKKADANVLEKEYSKEIAKLLRFEKTNLSDMELRELWDHKASYHGDDLIVIDYNAAFIFDPVEPLDLLNVLEYANIQLLELRYYDSALDKNVSAAYDDVEKLKKPSLWHSYSKTMKKVSETQLGVEEIIEKIHNALKLIGDMYLAKVYSLAAKEFHLDEWESNVNKKLAIVEGIYSKLEDRVSSRRFMLLEILLVILEIIFISVTVGDILHLF